MVKAVIFDMDGVIVDTEVIDDLRIKEFLDLYHIPVEEKERKRLAGLESKQHINYMVRWWREAGDTDTTSEQIQERYEVYKQKMASEKPISFGELQDPDAKTVMEALKSRGYKVALASSSSFTRINQVIEETGIGGYLDVVVSGRMFQKSKPNPDIYLYTVQEIGAQAGECVAVEDSTYGIQAAKSAGLITFAKRDDRFCYDQTAADFQIDRLSQLLDLLGTLEE